MTGRELAALMNAAKSKITYIHYGATEFDVDLFHPVRNGGVLGKPMQGTGLWASRFGDEYGWKAWCALNEFRKCDEENAFCFELADWAQVVLIEHPEQLESLPMDKAHRLDEGAFPFVDESVHLDFEKMFESGVDAIEIIWGSSLFGNFLWGWDCSCIFVMNPNIVVPVPMPGTGDFECPAWS